MKSINLSTMNIPEYTEGICGEAAAILKDGVMMPIPEILKKLNNYSISIHEIEEKDKEITRLNARIEELGKLITLKQD